MRFLAVESGVGLPAKTPRQERHPNPEIREIHPRINLRVGVEICLRTTAVGTASNITDDWHKLRVAHLETEIHEEMRRGSPDGIVRTNRHLRTDPGDTMVGKRGIDHGQDLRTADADRGRQKSGSGGTGTGPQFRMRASLLLIR
jgi:hypothetical protein